MGEGSVKPEFEVLRLRHWWVVTHSPGFDARVIVDITTSQIVCGGGLVFDSNPELYQDWLAWKTGATYG